MNIEQVVTKWQNLKELLASSRVIDMSELFIMIFVHAWNEFVTYIFFPNPFQEWTMWTGTI